LGWKESGFYIMGFMKEQRLIGGSLHVYLLHFENTMKKIRNAAWRCLSVNVNKIQPDATVCRYLFTAKSLYMFQVSQHPSSGVLKTETAISGTGHNTGTATSPQCGLIGREEAVPVL